MNKLYKLTEQIYVYLEQIILTHGTKYFMHRPNYMNSSNKKVISLEQIIWIKRININTLKQTHDK